MNLKDKAYIAGFLDGEGEVGIHKMTEPDMVRGCRHRLEIAFTNTHKDVLLFIQSIYGGNISKKQLHSENHRQCYRLRIEGMTSIKLLRDVFPYLKIKRMQAEIAFQFAKTLRRVGGNTRRPITNRVFDKRENLYSEIKNINLTKSYVASNGGDALRP
jgi:hypothetical protein